MRSGATSAGGGFAIAYTTTNSVGARRVPTSSTTPLWTNRKDPEKTTPTPTTLRSRSISSQSPSRTATGRHGQRRSTNRTTTFSMLTFPIMALKRLQPPNDLPRSRLQRQSH